MKSDNNALTLSKNSSGLQKALLKFREVLEPPDNNSSIQFVPRLIPHDGQREIINSDAKYKVVICGRKFGKTELGIDEVIGTSLDGFPSAYFAPSYKAASAVWRQLKKSLSPVTARKLEGERTIELTTGGVVNVWSYHNMAAESSRPQSYKKVVIDEFALGSMDLWTEIIWPMLAVYDGDALFLTTPRGRLNCAYTVWTWGQNENDPDWQSWQMPTWINPHIPKSYIKRAKSKMSEDEFGQEIEAKFTKVAGAVYPTFSEEFNVTMRAEYDPNYPVYWSVDDGYTNPRAMLFFQERPMFGIEGCIVLFDMRYETMELAEDAIDAAMLLPGTEDDPAPAYQIPEFVYYDPAAPEFAAHCRSRGLPVWGAWNNVHEGIKVVRRFILNGAGVRRLFIHPRCRPAIDGMIGYHNPDNAADRAPSKGGDPNPVKKDDHACFVAGTLITTKRGQIPIEKIKNDDMILTRDGYYPLRACGLTKRDAQVSRVLFSNGMTLTATSDHPIWVNGQGFVCISDLQFGIIVSTLEDNRIFASCVKPSSWMVLSILAIRNLTTSVIDAILSVILPQSQNSVLKPITTANYGDGLTGLFQTIAIFIMMMATMITMPSIILFAWIKLNIFNIMQNSAPRKKSNGRAKILPSMCALKQVNGIDLTRDGNGIHKLHGICGKNANPKFTSVTTVGQNIKPVILAAIVFVAMRAKQHFAWLRAWMMSCANASDVAKHSWQINTKRPNIAAANVAIVKIENLDTLKDVYNLSVKHAIGEYYANGILVKNCDAIRYFIATRHVNDPD